MRTIALALVAFMAASVLFGILQDEGMAGPLVPQQEAIQPIQGYQPIHRVITGAAGTRTRIALGPATAGIVTAPADGFTFNIIAAPSAVAFTCSLKVISRNPNVTTGAGVGWQWFRPGESFDFPIYGADSVVVDKMTSDSDTVRIWIWRR